jgi:arsenate reductase
MMMSPEQPTKKKVLFICSHNAIRSPMAEGIVNAFLGDKYEAKSAGSKPQPVDPLATEAMKEIGIDISAHRPTSLKELQGQRFDLAVTLCAETEEVCPFFPGAEDYMTHQVNDPPGLKGGTEERRQAMRTIRDDIRRWAMETL